MMATLLHRGPGTAVARLSARLIRRGALLLALGVAVYAAIEVFSYLSTYPDDASRARLAQFEDSPAVRMLQGYPHAVDTTGGFVVWDGGWFMQSIVAIWALLVTGRLLRGEEDAERSEYVLAGPVRASRVIVLQLLVVATALTMTGALVAAVLIVAGTGITGSLLFGLGITGFAGVFCGIAAITAQIFTMRRRTTTLTAALFGVFFLIRMVANSTESRAWLHWISPFGWMDELHAYRDPRWTALALLVAVPALLGLIAVRLRLVRDTGGALRADADSRTARTRHLGGPTAFAWRTTRGMLSGWLLGIAAYALMIGSLIEAVADFVADDPNYRRVLEAIGWDLDQVTQAFLGYMGSMLGLFIALFTCWRIGAARTEESSGHLDNVLTRPVSRPRWLAGHIVLTLAGAALISLSAALAIKAGAWLAGAQIGLSDCLGAVFAAYPVALLAAGAAVLIYGTAPRLTTGLSVALVVTAYLLQMLGQGLKWPDWILNISPFHHIPPVPAEPFAPLSATVLSLLGAALLMTGLFLFMRRDLAGD